MTFVCKMIFAIQCVINLLLKAFDQPVIGYVSSFLRCYFTILQ